MIQNVKVTVFLISEFQEKLQTRYTKNSAIIKENIMQYYGNYLSDNHC